EGGESPKEVFIRCHKAVQRFIHETTQDHLILVVHGRVLRILLAGWVLRDLSRMQEYAHQNANINHLHLQGTRISVKALNETAHLI
ncbi:histidine phosphatase family protein, partial [Arthrospira platensis SPKY1]|nr:histidine phosphatase family protein [Arthrospira platensis SPKY1]